MTEQTLTFEDALAELENIVARLESGELTLEETLTLYERGQELAAWCNKMLDEAELRLEKLDPATGSMLDVASPCGPEE